MASRSASSNACCSSVFELEAALNKLVAAWESGNQSPTAKHLHAPSAPKSQNGFAFHPHSLWADLQQAPLSWKAPRCFAIPVANAQVLEAHAQPAPTYASRSHLLQILAHGTSLPAEIAPESTRRRRAPRSRQRESATQITNESR